MAVTLYSTATEYVAVPLTITRGVVGDIVSVGMFVSVNPSTIPTVAGFTTVTLVDGTSGSPPPLAVIGEIDVLALVGPGGQITGLSTNAYQVWVLVKTATENIIRKVDTLTIL